jgi:flagellar basal-body rod protein FlgB
VPAANRRRSGQELPLSPPRGGIPAAFVPVFRRGTALAPALRNEPFAEAHVAIDFDRHLGVLPAALELQARRTEVIAANLANADTPNFKARDLDFRAALVAAGAPGATLPLAGTNTRHLGTAGSTGTGNADLKYRTPLAPALDGNTVDANLEQAAFAENAVRYQATLTFLNGKFRSLMTAITGQ